MAIRGLGDVQVSQKEAIYGGSQHVLDCVDGISEQGEEMSERACIMGPCDEQKQRKQENNNVKTSCNYMNVIVKPCNDGKSVIARDRN